MDNQKERDKQEILQLVEEYCEKYHRKKPFSEGDKINYAARVYGAEEMKNLVNSALDFWLTSGEYTERFEREFAAFLFSDLSGSPVFPANLDKNPLVLFLSSVQYLISPAAFCVFHLL